MIAYLLIAIGTIPTNARLVPTTNLSTRCEQVESFLCDISFGERQLEQFVCDRPETAEIIKRETMLRHMLVWHFAGGLTGKRLYWDCTEPRSGQPAEHNAYFDQPVLIRVSKNRTASGIDKVTYLLFELLNYTVDEEYVLLLNAATEEKISREEFAERCVRAEFEAGKRTRLFFLLNPIEGATFINNPDYYAILNASGNFSEYLQWLKGRNSNEFDPLKYYGVSYDQILSYKKDKDAR